MLTEFRGPTHSVGRVGLLNRYGDLGDPRGGMARVLSRMFLCAVRETLGR